METTLTIIISSLTGVITFFVGHRKARKETEGLQLDNISKSVSIYQIIINDLKEQLDTLLTKVDELESKIDALKEENCELKKMVEKCGKMSQKLNNKVI
jgi:peptidoglycan hydrolase CwlO-like protein